jgi:hypothetical protein
MRESSAMVTTCGSTPRVAIIASGLPVGEIIGIPLFDKSLGS